MIESIVRLLADSARYFGIVRTDAAPASLATAQLIDSMRFISARSASAEQLAAQLSFLGRNHGKDIAPRDAAIRS